MRQLHLWISDIFENAVVIAVQFAHKCAEFSDIIPFLSVVLRAPRLVVGAYSAFFVAVVVLQN